MEPLYQSWVDQKDARLVDAIRRTGWFIQYVGGSCTAPGCDCLSGDGPDFAYTIGLYGMGHPELVIFDVDPGEALSVLNHLSDRVRTGENLLPGVLAHLDRWPGHLVPEEVPNPAEIVLGADRFYEKGLGESVPALQVSNMPRRDRARGPIRSRWAVPRRHPFQVP